MERRARGIQLPFSNPDAKKPPEGGFPISRYCAREERRSRNYLLAAGVAAIAAVAADEAAAMAPVAADEAASVAEEAAAATDEAASATDEAATATDEAAEAASAAADVAVSVLLQAARAATATREANRSDLFMNILEENFGFEPLPVIQILALTAGILAKDSRTSSSISCA